MQQDQPVSSGVTPKASPVTVRTRVASSNIAKGDVVVWDPTDTTGNTVSTTTTAQSLRVYGIALAAASAGKLVPIAVPGDVGVAFVEANVAAGTAVDDVLGTSTTAGVLGAVTDVGSAVAVAVTAESGGKATVALKYF